MNGIRKATAASVDGAAPSAVLQTSLGDDPFRLLFENSMDAILIADENGRFLDVNQPACDMFGYSREQMLCMGIGDLATPELPGAAEQYKFYLERGREIGEFTFVRPDSQVRVASFSACRLAHGQHLSILRDLTQQKREQEAAAKELARQAHLFDTVLSSIVDFTYTFDRDCRFTYSNQALLDLWQLKREEALGKNFSELNYPPELAARLQRQIQSVFDSGAMLKDETPYTALSGTIGYYEYIFVPVFDKDGQVELVAGSTRDISERYAMEAQLREAKSRMEATLNAGEIGTWTWTIPDDRVVADRNLARFFSVSEEDANGGPIARYTEAIHTDDRQRVEIVIQTALQNHENYEAEYRLVDKDGNVRLVIARGCPEYTEEGKPLALHGVALDITRLKAQEAEIHALNSRLRLAMKETHHRVKNNLQMISAMIDMQMLERLGDQGDPREAFHQLKTHVHTLSIVHDLLSDNVKADGDASPISLKAILEKLLPMLQQTAGHRSIQYSIDDVKLPSNLCIALALVINELVTNALKHGKKEVNVVFNSEEEQAQLAVLDDGPGFPEGFDALEAANMGLELVDSLVRTDLKGRSHYLNRPQGGGHVLVSFPVPPREE